MTRFKRSLKRVIWPGVTFALCDSSVSLNSPQGKWGSQRNCIVTLNIHNKLDIKKQVVSPMPELKAHISILSGLVSLLELLKHVVSIYTGAHL